MNNEEIKWTQVWKTSLLEVTETKKGNRKIYTLSCPLNDDAINIEGEEMIVLARLLLKRENDSEMR